MHPITITCPHCGLAKHVPEDKLPVHEVRVTCPRCKGLFPLSCGRQTPSHAGTGQEPAASPLGDQASAAAVPSKSTVIQQSWRVSSQVRHLCIVFCVLAGMHLLSCGLVLLVSGSNNQIVYFYTAVTAIVTLVTIAFTIWRNKIPLFVFSPRGLRVTNSPFDQTRDVPWGEIIGLAVRESGIFGTKSRQLRLLLGGTKPLRELLINTKIVERPDELMAQLQKQVPPLTAGLLAATGRLEGKNEREVRFGPHILSATGIAASRQLIPWSAVSDISTPLFVLAGYGGVTIRYRAGMKTAKLAVAAKMTPQYQDFIRTILRCAPHAAIDPGVAKILDCPPQEAKRESVAILLLLLAMVLTLAAAFLATNYAPTVPLKAVFSLAATAAGFIPFLAGIILLARRFRGRVGAVSRTLAWAGAACAGPVVTILLLFVLFPSARYYMRGDNAYRNGELESAAQYLNQALAASPDNLDACFTLGMVYREKQDYARSFDCLQKVYLVDANNWQAVGMELIPDALLKAGRYDEALTWCDRIERDHPRRSSVTAAMASKRREILRAKGKAI